MKKVFIVFHTYDVDGGFGDAVSKKSIAAIFTDKKAADDYVDEYSNPVVYDTPYNDLYMGKLSVKEYGIYEKGDVPPDFDPNSNMCESD